MRKFKLTLRWIVFLLIFFIYYFICLGLIESRMSPEIGVDNGITTFLMFFAIISPFIVIKYLFKWLYPANQSIYFRSVLALSIVVGILLHLFEVNKEEKLDKTYIPYYALVIFISLNLFLFKKDIITKEERDSDYDKM